MSTRATYHFGPAEQAPKTTFYIHGGGYPSHAVEYYRNMGNVLAKYPGCGAADTFFRENVSAQLTWGHAAHFDSEYRYDYAPATGQLTVQERMPTGRFNRIFRGTLGQFFEQYETK